MTKPAEINRPVRYILYSILLLMFAPVLAEEEEQESELSGEYADKFRAAEEKHKDNPYMMRLINQIKEGVIEKQKNQPQQPAEPEKPAFDASKGTADSAYSQADYATAFQHYKVLAEEGDPEAAMMLGVLYQSGQGTEQNDAAAHAWYRKAAEGGETGSAALLEQMEISDLSEEEYEAALQYYDDLDEKPGEQPDTGPGAQGKTGSAQTVTSGGITVTIPGRTARATVENDTPRERRVRFTPERIKPYDHPTLASSQPSHPEPTRFFRN